VDGVARTAPAGRKRHRRRLGQPLISAIGDEYPAVNTTAFAPEGNTLAIGVSLTVTLWDISGLNALRADPTKRACAIAGSGLSEADWARYVPGLPYTNTCRS
jgi:hypothetical protein